MFPLSVLFSYKLPYNVALDNYTISPNNAVDRHQYCPASIINDNSIELSWGSLHRNTQSIEHYDQGPCCSRPIINHLWAGHNSHVYVPSTIQIETFTRAVKTADINVGY